VLTKNGSGVLSRQQLERLCIMTAQRISLLQEFDAPEFYDRNLFQQFINELRKRDYLVTDGDGEMEFGERLALMAEDARFFLEKDIRHGILQGVPQMLEPTPTS
jgi:glycerol-3-phosphate O-acyltransferase